MNPRNGAMVGTRLRRRGLLVVLAPLCALGSLLVAASPAGATTTTLYVAAGGTNAGNDCTSSNSPCATVSFALTKAVAGDTIDVSGAITGEVTVSVPVTITGADAPSDSPAVLEGDGEGSVVTVEAGSVTLDTLTIKGGSLGTVDEVGAGVWNEALGTAITNCSILDNSGPGVDNGGDSLMLSDSTIADNGGPGVENGLSGLTIAGSTIMDNAGAGVSQSTAGSVAVSGSTISGNLDGIADGVGSLTVTGSTISDNAGFGISTSTSQCSPQNVPEGCPVAVTGSTIMDNTGVGLSVDSGVVSTSTISGNGAGGVVAYYHPLSVTGSIIADNTGSGITTEDCFNFDDFGPVDISCPLTVSDSRIDGNTGDGVDAGSGATLTSSAVADNGGAGIENLMFELTLTGGSVVGNLGVGIEAEQGADISASTVSDNLAGGVYVNGGGGDVEEQEQGAGSIEVTDNTIAGNSAIEGGGIYLCECSDLSSAITVTGNTITRNTATDGGGIYIASEYNALVSDNTIVANTATDGGGLYNDGLVSLSDSTLSGNVSADGDSVFNAAPAADAGPSTLAAAADIFDGGCRNLGTWDDGGFNVGSDGTCLAAGTADVDYGSGLRAFGVLGPLADNGGSTETMLPRRGDPAIGIVPLSTVADLLGSTVTLCPVTDQRGVQSAPGRACNAGSVQYVGVLAITAPSPTITYGQAVPTLTPGYSGFASGYGAASLTRQPSCTTAASSTSRPGTYPVRCSGAADPYYTLHYVPGTLTVKWPFSLVLTGSVAYANQGAVVAGSLTMVPSSGTITSVAGRLTIPGVAGGTARVKVEIVRIFGLYAGTISLSDPSAHLKLVAHVLCSKLTRTPIGEVTGKAFGFEGSRRYTMQFTL